MLSCAKGVGQCNGGVGQHKRKVFIGARVGVDQCKEVVICTRGDVDLYKGKVSISSRGY